MEGLQPRNSADNLREQRIPERNGCPLCGTLPAGVGDQTSWTKLWSALEAEFNRSIPADVRRRYQVGDVLELATCSTCGLRFFSPAIPGGPDFYSFLQDSDGGYYNELTWEGRVVVSLIEDYDDVLDLGTGDGALLRALPARRTGRTVGVDHFKAAIEALREGGIEGSTDDFETFAARERANFDVVCAMQVLEHMADAKSLMAAARECLRPGGRIFIAVPDDERDRDRFEPLDYPPHHMSRWVQSDFSTLAARFGLRVASVRHEPGGKAALRRLIVARWEGRLGRALSRVLLHLTTEGAAARLVRHWAPEASVVGHSMLVELRLPESA